MTRRTPDRLRAAARVRARQRRDRPRAGGRGLRGRRAERRRAAAARSRFTPAASRDARDFARRAIEAFETAGVERIVVNAAGCGSSMKEYERLFADDPRVGGARARVHRPGARRQRAAGGARAAARAAAPAASARRLSRRLSPGARAGRPAAAARSAAADSRASSWSAFAEPELCCGSAGIYNLVQPEPARQLGERKVAHIAAVRPDVVATANPGLHAADASVAAEQGAPLKVMHPIELIDASIRGSAIRSLRAQRTPRAR